MTADPGDPWKDIAPPGRAPSVSARRVDPASPWGVFWAVDSDRNCLLILQHRKEIEAPHRLPRLRGLRVDVHAPADEPHDWLVIRLVDREQREIFHRLCLDIVAATGLARTEEQAIQRFLARTWRWHRLLTGARDGRLSDEEQKGLLGELGVLGKRLVPALGAAEAVKCWTGPLDSPKDFEIGGICVEAKTRRGAAAPHVAVSSEHQLDSSGVDILFLHVAEVSAGGSDAAGAVTITEVASDLREMVAECDMAAVDLLEERLTAAGFEWTDDYSDRRWILGREHLFEVREGFPRVVPSMLPHGVSNLRYTISLRDCEPFRVEAAALVEAISGEDDDG